MSLFKQLFGKSERKRTLEKGEKESSDSGKISKVFVCTICGKEGIIEYSKEEGYEPARYIVSDKPAELFKYRFVSVCPKEMIYVCSKCAKWVKVKPEDNLFFPLTKEEMGSDAREWLNGILNKEWRPVCPRCDTPLEGKTSADLKFYANNVGDITRLLRSGKREECKQLCLKLLRILEEEKECFIERGIMSEQDFERRFRALEGVISNLWDHL